MKLNKQIREGIDETGTPDMKYYAFDWDDNIMNMPTKIILNDEEGNEVEMSTEDFAEYRGNFNKQGIAEVPFEYDGHTIVSLDKDAFRYFTVSGDKLFTIDAMTASEGPAWPDFVEAINNGSIFSIVTARGHTPSVIKNAVYNLIISNHNGIDSNELVKNLQKYRDLDGGEQISKKEMIDEYLDLCRFYPVTYGEGTATKPEQGKIKAIKDFINHIKNVSQHLKKRAFLKNVIINHEPQLGFSDDDLRNIQVTHSEFKDDDVLKGIYHTSSKGKKKYE